MAPGQRQVRPRDPAPSRCCTRSKSRTKPRASRWTGTTASKHSQSTLRAAAARACSRITALMRVLLLLFCVLCRSAPLIAVSQSNSAISLWQLCSGGPVLQQSWVAHEYELWIVSFDTHDSNVLYSGADDCKFKGWDLRAGRQGPRSSTFVSSEHSMGVCSIQSHPSRSHVLATGSYDETLRIWDTRALGRGPLLVASHELGGGLWRVRWNPHTARHDSILCCAMHNGFAALQVNFQSGDTAATAATKEEEEDISNKLAASSVSSDAASSSSAACSSAAPSTTTVVSCVSPIAVYKAHSSLAYGADWCSKPAASSSAAPPPSSVDADLIATCSFYDKQMDVWTIGAAKSEPVTAAATPA